MSIKKYSIEKYDFNTYKELEPMNLVHFMKLLLIRYVKSPVTYLSFFIPFIMIFGLGSILNPDVTYMATLSTSLVAHGFIAFGTSYFQLRKSTLNKNISNSGLHKAWMHVIVGLFTIVTTMIFSFLVMGIYLLISMIPGVFYTDAFETIKPVGNLNISNGRYGLLVYYTFLSSLMTVVMGYFFQTMVKGVKGFMAISIAYLILMVLFGAVITYNYAELAIIHNGEAMIAEDYFHMIFEQAGILRSDVTGQMTDVEATFDWYLEGVTYNGKEVTWEGSWWLRYADAESTDNGAHIMLIPEDAIFVQSTADGEPMNLGSFTTWMSILMPHFWVNNIGQPALMEFNNSIQAGISGFNAEMLESWRGGVQPSTVKLEDITTMAEVNIDMTNSANPEYLMSHWMPYVYIAGFTTIGIGISTWKGRRG